MFMFADIIFVFLSTLVCETKSRRCKVRRKLPETVCYNYNDKLLLLLILWSLSSDFEIG